MTMARDFTGRRVPRAASAVWSLPTLQAQPTPTATARPVPQPDSLLVRAIAFAMPTAFCVGLLLTAA